MKNTVRPGEINDECVVSGLSLDETMTCNDVQTGLFGLANKIYEK